MLVNTLRHDVKGGTASEFTLIYEGPGAAYRSRFLLFVPTGTVQYSTVLGGSNSNLTSPKKQSEARAQESKHIEEGPKPIFYYLELYSEYSTRPTSVYIGRQRHMLCYCCCPVKNYVLRWTA